MVAGNGILLQRAALTILRSLVGTGGLSLALAP